MFRLGFVQNSTLNASFLKQAQQPAKHKRLYINQSLSRTQENGVGKECLRVYFAIMSIVHTDCCLSKRNMRRQNKKTSHRLKTAQPGWCKHVYKWLLGINMSTIGIEASACIQVLEQSSIQPSQQPCRAKSRQSKHVVPWQIRLQYVAVAMI